MRARRSRAGGAEGKRRKRETDSNWFVLTGSATMASRKAMPAEVATCLPALTPFLATRYPTISG